MNNKIKEKLIELKELLTKDRWTYNTSARDSNDIACDISDPDASKFCFFGAVVKVTSNEDAILWNILVSHLSKSGRKIYSEGAFSIINDKLGFDAVHQVIDHAIKEIK